MSVAHVARAVDEGADAVGFILAESPRQITPDMLRDFITAVPPMVTPVAVLANPTPALVADVIAMGCVPQFSGEESAIATERLTRNPYIKALHFEKGRTYAADEIVRMSAAFGRATLLFDTRDGAKRGGTGHAFDWSMLADFARRRRLIVSGGLTAENVGACIRTVRPFAVDVRSGVETDDTHDATKIRAFIRAVNAADAQA